MERIETNAIIDAPRSLVWDALTNPTLMARWMGTPEMNIQVETTWQVGAPIRISGSLHGTFENNGTVVRFEPERVLCYTHLDSASRLPDEPQNYTRMCFELAEAATQTSLTVTINGFPTPTIYKHHNFYWRSAMVVLKRFVEKQHFGGRA